MSVGEVKELSLSEIPEGIPVAWTSSNQNVIQVLNGKCVAIGIGKSVISAVIGGKSIKCNISVTDTPDSTIVINAGEGKGTKINGIKKAKKISYTSSDNSISISKGKILVSKSLMKPINLDLTDGHRFLIYANNIKPIQDNFSIKTGECVFVMPEDCHELPIWTSKNPNIAIISEYGVLIGCSAGSTTISTKIRGKKVTVNVNVSDEIYTGEQKINSRIEYSGLRVPPIRKWIPTNRRVIPADF